MIRKTTIKQRLLDSFLYTNVEKKLSNKKWRVRVSSYMFESHLVSYTTYGFKA